MPCHAFSLGGVLLLARGERIADGEQLVRLLEEDVYLGDAPPLLDARAVRDASGEGTPGPASPRSSEHPIHQAGVPLAQELASARELRTAALRQARQVADEMRAGRPLDLAPVHTTVVDIVQSVQRNHDAMSSLVQLRASDEYTFTHSVNTCVLSVLIAQQFATQAEAIEIGMGALVHDLGKLAIPAEILNKPMALTDEEWQLMRTHPTAGIECLPLGQRMGSALSEAIGQHHERLNGRGYPGGLSGQAISRVGRVVALADVYDAVTSDRPYHRAMPPPEAMRMIVRNAEGEFDLELSRLLLRAIGAYPVGSLVRLNTGEVAVVSASNPESVQRPILLVVSTPWDGTLPRPQVLDLSETTAAARHIVALEDAAGLGVNPQQYLAAAPDAAVAELPGLDAQG
jgi:HD-GYP domain-containing protein (c-di-GMP phosphodiesterase class II)